jgi:aubergine
MTEAIQAFKAGYMPKILYVFVNKETNSRFFETEGKSVLNPPEGTVVDTDLVELDESSEKFDFYMIPHHASIATARPVHYIVAKNDGLLTKRAIQQFTYNMCYGYFNFGGSIKVPATVMYAHKIANYCYELGTTAIPEALQTNLHFL